MTRAHELAQTVRRALLIGRSGREPLLALAELEHLGADAERLRDALERVAALNGGYPDDYCEIARAALEAAE